MISRKELWFHWKVVLCCSLRYVTRLLDSHFLTWVLNPFQSYLTRFWGQSPNFYAVDLLYEVWSKCQHYLMDPHFLLCVLFPFSCHSLSHIEMQLLTSSFLFQSSYQPVNLCSAGCTLISVGHTKKHWLPLVCREIDLVVSFSQTGL